MVEVTDRSRKRDAYMGQTSLIVIGSDGYSIIVSRQDPTWAGRKREGLALWY